MPDSILVQVRFSKQDKGGSEYNDALYFTLDEYSLLDPAVIEDQKTARFEAWKEVIANPPIPVEPTKAELQAQYDALVSQEAQLAQMKDELAAVIAAKPDDPPKDDGGVIGEVVAP